MFSLPDSITFRCTCLWHPLPFPPHLLGLSFGVIFSNLPKTYMADLRAGTKVDLLGKEFFAWEGCYR